MKKLLLLTALVAVACSNDSDYYPVFEKCNWETSLGEILNNNKENFQSKDIEILSAKLLEEIKVDSSLFFGEEYGYYPVYTKKDSLFEVINFKKSLGVRDDCNISPETSARISSLIDRSDDYDVIELSWRCGTDHFKSISLFNKRTGELEYDNMLFNMETIQRYSGENFALFLSNAEIQNVDTDYHDSRSVQWTVGGRVVSWAGITWSASGYWRALSEFYYEDAEYRYYMMYYNYTCTESDISGGGHSDRGYDCFVEYRNNTVNNQPRYDFKYALWAGPEGGLDKTNFNLQLMSSSEMSNRITSGQGEYGEINGPDRNAEPQVVRVHK